MTKKQKLTKTYRQERQKYLARLRYYKSRGYETPESRAIPKTITEASIRALQYMTGARIKSQSKLYDIRTSQPITPTGKSDRKRIEKANLKIYKQQKIEKQKSIKAPKKDRMEEDYDIPMSEATLPMRESYEMIIENWYRELRTFPVWMARRVESWTNYLIEDQPKEVRMKFAWTYAEYPNIFPHPPSSDEEYISACFTEIMNLMNIAEGSEAYWDFVRDFDPGVEDEE